MKIAPIGIGAALVRHRERKGLTQEEVADQLALRFNWPRVSRAMVSQWEAERPMPGDLKLVCLEEFIGVEPGTFLLEKLNKSLRSQGIDLPPLQFAPAKPKRQPRPRNAKSPSRRVSHR